jgi:hypothetical protein
MKTIKQILLLSGALLALSASAQGQLPLEIGYVTNSPPPDFLVFVAAPDLVKPVTNWMPYSTIRGYQIVTTNQVGSLVQWQHTPTNWLAITTTNSLYYTNPAVWVTNVTLPYIPYPGATNQFFAVCNSNIGGLVSPFSVPLGVYTPSQGTVWVQGR